MKEKIFRGMRSDNGDWESGGSIVKFENSNGQIEFFILKKGESYKAKLDINDNIIAFLNCAFYKVIPETVGQYIGLTDKNGKRIFEGDIVEYNEEYGQIEYHDDEAMYVVSFDTWFTDFDHICGIDVEVVGTVYGNPELLGEKV